MIKYDKLLEICLSRRINSYVLKRDKVIGQASWVKIQQGGTIDTVTLGKLCKYLQCQPGDLLSYEDDDRPGHYPEYQSVQEKNYTPEEDAKILEEIADQPFGRWATIPGIPIILSENTPEQKRVVEEVNAMRAKDDNSLDQG